MRADQLDEIIFEVKSGTLEAHAARVVIDTIKWQCSKERPKVYGDKIQHEGGDPDKPINHRHGFGWMTQEQAQVRGWE